MAFNNQARPYRSSRPLPTRSRTKTALDVYKEYNEWRQYGHNDYLKDDGHGNLINLEGTRLFNSYDGRELDINSREVLDTRIPTANNQLDQKYLGVYRPDPVEKTDKEKFIDAGNKAFDSVLISIITGGNPINSVFNSIMTNRDLDPIGLWGQYDNVRSLFGYKKEEPISTSHFKKYENVNPQLYIYNELETDINSSNFGKPIISFDKRDDDKYMTFNVDVGITGQRTPLDENDPRYIKGYDNWGNIINQEEVDRNIQQLRELDNE